MKPVLYDYWRSSAAYRVRIALHLKGVAFDQIAVDINPAVSEQAGPAFRAINPQGRVPALDIGAGVVLTQSLAIIDWLDASVPEPALLPADIVLAARVRAFALTIACDIHPLNNLAPLAYLRTAFGADEAAVNAWYHHWISEGFAALERMSEDWQHPWLSGEAPGLAEICLVPQMANARRFKVPLDAFPRLVAIDARCLQLEAFQRAAPERQPGAPGA
jgi:maleylacetoacetate isomerase